MGEVKEKTAAELEKEVKADSEDPSRHYQSFKQKVGGLVEKVKTFAGAPFATEVKEGPQGELMDSADNMKVQRKLEEGETEKDLVGDWEKNALKRLRRLHPERYRKSRTGGK